MALDKYIGPNETIHLSFGMSIQYFTMQVILITLFFAAFAWFMQGVPYFVWIITIAGVAALWYRSHFFFTTKYFVTEDKIYKKTGIFWTKLQSSKDEEIENIEVRQGFLAKLVFDMGTIKFKTATTDSEIELKNVADPFKRKKQIEAVFALP
ncbi:PH domain-containing protein [Candidatus Gracilibacteria bacterium]|nr:PH domain-containing protein [Candidatus Gracilibacteria bacterium]